MPNYTHNFSLTLYADSPVIALPALPDHLLAHRLFTTITHCYLPCLRMLEMFADEGICSTMTLCLSPSLLDMLDSPAVQTAYLSYLRDSLTDGNAHEAEEEDLLRNALHAFDDRYEKNLVDAFARLAHTGTIQLGSAPLCSTILPLFRSSPMFIQQQTCLGVAKFQERFGADPALFYLPGLAWDPELDFVLSEQLACPTVWSSHGGSLGSEQTSRPITTPAGLRGVFADITLQDALTGVGGYAKSPVYRNAARPPRGDGTAAGYQPARACEAAQRQGLAFAHSCLSGTEDTIIALELENFGYAWREGFFFLEACLRTLHAEGARLASPEDIVRLSESTDVCAPQISSYHDQALALWGQEPAASLYPDLHMMISAVSGTSACAGISASLVLLIRSLMYREIALLSQSFLPLWLASRNTAKRDYAQTYRNAHSNRFAELERMLSSGEISDVLLRAVDTSSPISIPTHLFEEAIR